MILIMLVYYNVTCAANVRLARDQAPKGVSEFVV
jgi:hypothetical protein